jgi:DNA-binding NarL/FixJ family response regulator
VTALRATGTAVVALTGSSDELLLGGVIAAGASDVVSKVAPVHELLERVHAALRGESRLGATQRLALLDQVRRHQAEQAARLAPFASLTRREAAVLGRMMDGESADHIAAACFVSLPTVRSQIRAVLTKLGVNSQLAAVAMAYRAGWAPGPERSR